LGNEQGDNKKKLDSRRAHTEKRVEGDPPRFTRLNKERGQALHAGAKKKTEGRMGRQKGKKDKRV